MKPSYQTIEINLYTVTMLLALLPLVPEGTWICTTLVIMEWVVILMCIAQVLFYKNDKMGLLKHFVSNRSTFKDLIFIGAGLIIALAAEYKPAIAMWSAFGIADIVALLIPTHPTLKEQTCEQGRHFHVADTIAKAFVMCTALYPVAENDFWIQVLLLSIGTTLFFAYLVLLFFHKDKKNFFRQYFNNPNAEDYIIILAAAGAIAMIAEKTTLAIIWFTISAIIILGLIWRSKGPDNTKSNATGPMTITRHLPSNSGTDVSK